MFDILCIYKVESVGINKHIRVVKFPIDRTPKYMLFNTYYFHLIF